MALIGSGWDQYTVARHGVACDWSKGLTNSSGWGKWMRRHALGAAASAERCRAMETETPHDYCLWDEVACLLLLIVCLHACVRAHARRSVSFSVRFVWCDLFNCRLRFLVLSK